MARRINLDVVENSEIDYIGCVRLLSKGKANKEQQIKAYQYLTGKLKSDYQKPFLMKLTKQERIGGLVYLYQQYIHEARNDVSLGDAEKSQLYPSDGNQWDESNTFIYEDWKRATCSELSVETIKKYSERFRNNLTVARQNQIIKTLQNTYLFDIRQLNRPLI